jgi:hypothetical protein
VGLPLVAILATVLSYSLSAKYFGTALW